MLESFRVLKSSGNAIKNHLLQEFINPANYLSFVYYIDFSFKSSYLIEVTVADI